MFWSRLCTGTALSKDVTVRSDCDPSTERLCQQDGGIGVGSSKGGDASGLGLRAAFSCSSPFCIFGILATERLFSEKSNL